MKKQLVAVFGVLFLAGLFFSSLLGCSGTGTNSTVTTSTSTTTSLSTTTTSGAGPSSMPGTWRGTWTDTRYYLSGSVEAVIAAAGSVLSGTATVDCSSLGFMGIASETGTLGAVVSGQNANFTFNLPTVGYGLGAFTAETFSGTGEITGVIAYGGFTFIGTLESNGNTFRMAFDFDAASAGYGTWEMTKQ